MTDIWHFAWTVRGTANRPEPQKLADFALDRTYATTRNQIICSRRLTDEETQLSLDELAKKYPTPQMVEND